MTDPRDFGAAGDGKTDDSAALQHAVDSGDGVLELRKAVYRLTRALTLDLTKQGFGGLVGRAGTSRLVMAGPGPAVRIVGDHRGTADPSSVQPHTWDRARMPVVREVEIVGEHPQAVGIQLLRTMQCTISGVLVRRCRIGVHLSERNRNFILADSHLYDNAHFGLFFDRCNLHQAIVHGCHISYNQRGGIKSLNGDVHNLQITGNDIEYNRPRGQELKGEDTPPAADVWFEAKSGVISEVTIASNTIQATPTPGGANLRIDGSEDDSPRMARLITVTGNVLGSQTRGIQLRHVQRAAVTGNTIYDSRDLSLLAEHCAGLTFAANTITWRGNEGEAHRDGIRLVDCQGSVIHALATERLCSGSAVAGAAVTLVRCRDVGISGCQVLDPLVRGVELEDCRRCRVTDNSVLDRRAKPTMLQAIRVRGESSRDNLVQNNLLGGARDKNVDAPKPSARLMGNVEVDVP